MEPLPHPSWEFAWLLCRGGGKRGGEGETMGRFLRLTDPSHQRGQDLQVLSLLDVEEGERSEEEGEDSLGTERTMRQCAEG